MVVGPWAPRPAGGAGQPLLASLLCIDFCCSALPRRLLAGGDESSAHPPHLPLSWLGWPSLPTMPQLWLAPAGSSGPLYAAPGPQEEGSQRAHGDPQLRSPALGSPASKPPPRTASIRLSFHHSTHSASLFRLPLPPPPPRPAAHKQPETETEGKKKENQVNLKLSALYPL